MRNLILLFAKYGNAIAFVILEFICFYLIINFNQSQQEIWLHSANLFSGSINEKVSDFNGYFDLRNSNDSLLQKNAELLQTIINYRIFDVNSSFEAYEATDSTQVYTLIPAQVCGKTVHLQHNYMALNKGGFDGIESGMGVISQNGIVGIVKETSDNFSKVLLLTHLQSRISASIKSKNYSGFLSWKNADPRIHQLESIPKHAELSIGDTIITSGYSTSFPEGIEIGTIQNFVPMGASNNLEIDVKLFDDISSLNFAYCVKYKYVEEKEKIEEEVEQ